MAKAPTKKTQAKPKSPVKNTKKVGYNGPKK